MEIGEEEEEQGHKPTERWPRAAGKTSVCLKLRGAASEHVTEKSVGQFYTFSIHRGGTQKEGDGRGRAGTERGRRVRKWREEEQSQRRRMKSRTREKRGGGG